MIHNIDYKYQKYKSKYLLALKSQKNMKAVGPMHIDTLKSIILSDTLATNVKERISQILEVCFV